MGRRCCVPGCKSLRGNANATGDGKIQIHKFPALASHREEWICAIPRKRSSWTPTEHSGVCSMHFHEDDYETTSQDKQVRRKKNRMDNVLKLRRLKPFAIPSTFPGLPSYYSKSHKRPRSEHTTFFARRQAEAKRLEDASSFFMEQDKISSLEELSAKLANEQLPIGTLKVEREDKIYLYDFQDLNGEAPGFNYCLVINNNLEFKAYKGSSQLAPRKYFEHIIKKDKISMLSQVTNMLVVLNNMPDIGSSADEKITQSTNLLEKAIPDLSDQAARKISFSIEQIKLALSAPGQRRYSSSLLAMSAMWLAASTSCYKVIEQDDVMTLPTQRHIQHVCSSMTHGAGFSVQTIEYLSKRASNLTDQEKKVSVILDEVYNAKRVEYVGGCFAGLEDGQITKTMLGFMVTSICGSYRDVVSLVPVSKLTSDFVYDALSKVLIILKEVGFKVLTIVCDGHSVNRKLYTHNLCQGKIQETWQNIFDDDTEVHLLFDPTHLYKNLYTNFLNRRKFKCPNFQSQEIAPDFAHIEQMYQLELSKPVKISHKLIQKVLTPRPIERSNVMLAERLYHDSTIAGLEYFARNGHPEWQGTANWLKLVRKFWNIISVRTKFLGKIKRNQDKEPISSLRCSQVKFLVEFSEWLELWQEEGRQGDLLSKETFLCLIQTCDSMVSLIENLLHKEELEYVLTGKISSDPLERRFGQYRQLAGANYYVSVRQILESEKKIRLKALVKFNNLSLPDIRKVFISCIDLKNQALQADSVAIVNALPKDLLSSFEMDEDDSTVCYYVAGYLARSLGKQLTEECCISLVQNTASTPTLNFHVDCENNIEGKASLIEQVNRGGLTAPSDLLHITSQLAHQLFSGIMKREEVKKNFLKTENPREVFVLTLLNLLDNTPETQDMIKTFCWRGHLYRPLLEKAAFRFFNLFAKNFSSKVNDSLHMEKRRFKSADKNQGSRKMEKISGKTSDMRI